MEERILVHLIKGAKSKKELAHALGKSKRTRYLSDLMKKLLTTGLVEFTIPEKPNSRFQKYRLAASGRKIAEDL